MARSIFVFNTHDLPHRAGEMREYSLNFPAPEDVGIPLLKIPTGEEINLDFKAESVDDGVLITGIVRSHAVGECGRCLEKVEMEIDQRFQELFLYASRASDNPDEDDELFFLDGDDVFLPMKIEAQVEFMEQNSSVGLSLTPYFIYSDLNGPIRVIRNLNATRLISGWLAMTGFGGLVESTGCILPS